jgi:3-dehydroquinate synthase
VSELFAGAGVGRQGRWTRALRGVRQVALVSEARALRLCGADIKRALAKARIETFVHRLPEGEEAKTWSSVQALLSGMLSQGLGRDGAVVALGGGAVTDAAGFAASIYLRGVPWISCPTTLLGQLDSGLGGKTAINLPQGKNLAGTFYDPAAVVCDSEWLSTLPVRERVSGLAEGLKYGLVFDPALWALMTRRWKDLVGADEALVGAVVRRGAGWKLRVVAKDPRETAGPRELLNFGHTLGGHALEKAAGIGRLRHGEAVIWGMRAAIRLSVAAAGLPLEDADRVEGFLESLGVEPPRGVKAGAILAAAQSDKKARAGKLRFVLLRALGRPVVTDRVAPAAVKMVVEDLLR